VKWLGKGMFIATGVYQGVLEMVPFGGIFNQQIGHLEIKIRG
jgi:hypothetical protein